MSRISLIVGLSAMWGLGPACVLSSARAQQQIWLTQFGSNASEAAHAITTDGASGTYVAGWTGDIVGERDAFLARYDGAGVEMWSMPFGTTSTDIANALAPDGSGGVFVAGVTSGSYGGPSSGRKDAFVGRFDSAGNLIWRRQVGTSSSDAINALAPDGLGGVIAVGVTDGDLGAPGAGGNDIFLCRFDSAGNWLWTSKLGTNGTDVGQAIAPDGAGGVWIAGSTVGNLGGPNQGQVDAYVARYDADGNQVWVRQLGANGTDWAFALVPDSAGGVFASGFTDGDLGGPGAGGADAFVVRYDTDGNQLWVRQFGTSGDDFAFGLASDGTGGVMVAGETSGSLGGPNAGAADAYLARYDADGNQLNVLQFGTSGRDRVLALTPGGVGGVFMAGSTRGDLARPIAGLQDAFVARFGQACYADCDQSTGAGTLDIFDFLCFQNSFVASEPYACDCDTSTGPGVCDIFDFLCFQNAFVAGCP